MMTTTASDTSDPIVTPATDTVLTLPVHLAESQSAMSAEAGTVLRYQNAAFTVPTGGAWLNVPRFQVDDWGFLGAVPVGSTRSNTPAAFKIDCRKTAENQGTYGGHAQWGGSLANVFLPPGDYILVIEQQNEPITAVANRSLGEYEVSITACLPPVPGDDDSPDAPTPPDEPGRDPEICPPCGCSGSTEGDAVSNGSTGIPGDAALDFCSPTAEYDYDPASPAAGDDAPALVLPGGLKADSVWQWKLTQQAETGLITITPPYAAPLHFRVQPGSALATLAGGARKHRFALQLQDAQGAPCTGEPARFCLMNAAGMQVLFNTQGAVESVRSAEGRLTTAAQYDSTVVSRSNAAGYLESVYSPTTGLMRASVQESGATLYEWFAPQQVVPAGDSYEVTGQPYKTESLLTTLADGVRTLTITRRQQDLPPHTITRVEQGNCITITRGEGAEAIIRTIETRTPAENLREEIETTRRAGDTAPASCTRTLSLRSAGGWLLLESTEAFGTPLARTTYHAYNEQFQLIRVTRPDGGYTEYAYDAEGRVTSEISPWAQGGRQRTRYVYATGTSRFFENRPAKVYTDYKEAAGSWMNLAVTDYTYEESAEAERTTATTFAAGVSHQQVTVEEIYGPAPAYAYAAGKPKFSQDAVGVQTLHEYAATTAHGAVHLHTTTTQAAGALVAGQSRRTEEFIAADDTVSFEQESIWDGTQWLLLSTTAYEYDEQQRVVKTTRGNGRFSTSTWMCCGKLSETDEDGITTSYGYDSAHQLVEIIRAEVKDGAVVVTPETITTYTRDAAGRILSTRRDIGAMTTTESTAYDALGRVISRTDILGRVTTTTYSGDGLTTTETTPAGATRITQRNTDGSTAAVSGTSQRGLRYSYSVQQNCLCTLQTLAEGTIISQTTTNGFGQTVVQAQPNTLGGFICTRSEYNARGLLVKSFSDTGLGTEVTAPTHYEYDAMGNVVRQTLALAAAPAVSNSPVTETGYSAEYLQDGVYSITTTTRYNAAGQPLTNVQKQLISQLSPTLESKSVFVSERGLTSTTWSEYSENTKRTQYSTVPTSSITAEVVTVDGFTLSRKDSAGIVTSATRSYTATGMLLTQTDGRGNTTTTITDTAGRTISVTDAAGNVITTAYCTCCDQPATVTDALGNTSHYRYDARGRKVAEWGTGIQPVVFGHDDAGNMTSLTTFRNPDAVISTDPAEWEGLVHDTTTWTFDPATGLELSKTYADNTCVVKSYDAHNRLATETNARGRVKVHSYEHARGLLLNTTWYHPAQEGEEPVVDSLTTPRSFAYNHLGQLTQVVDAAGTRTIGYNQYGEQETDSLVVDGDTHLITETRDALGRSTGYVYSKNGATQQTVTTGYGAEGRIASAGFLHGGAEKLFSYEYLPGTHLLQKLTLPSNMTLTQSYEPQRDLLTGMCYKRSNTTVAERTYTYDALGRPLTRTTSRGVQSVTDSFGYNNRSELTTATVNNGAYAYDYDNIGNRKTAQENAEEVTGYQSNELNQYTAISVDGAIDFAPEYDADGNQTRVKTSTGIWAVNHDSENRPIDFYRIDSSGGTTVHCTYDHMGRRATKQVTVGNNVTLHQRYIYRGYLQVACIDLTRSHHPALWYITWDATQPVATRPLAIQLNGTWYTYGWDLTKNICELYGQHGYIRTAYTYAPYGQVSEEGDVTQPIQWSSEFNDTELGLIYYNYRHYNPVDSRWTGRDRKPAHNCYSFSRISISTIDILGNEEVQVEISGNKRHEVIRIKQGNIPEKLNVDALVPLIKGPDRSAATTQVLIEKKEYSCKM